jgi:hypothetical protein
MQYTGVDQLLDDARAAQDIAKRKELYGQVQKKVPTTCRSLHVLSPESDRDDEEAQWPGANRIEPVLRYR